METYQKFFQQLLLLYRPFENHLILQLAKHDIHRAQWTIMYYLANHQSATLVECANYQSVEKPTITRTVKRLEELGYVEHIPGKDKREKRIQLTELGRQIYQEVRVTINQFEQNILTGISEDDLHETIRIMKTVRTNLIT